MTRYPIVHFEMPYDDAERMSAFYASAFGWGMQNFGPEMGNYVTAETTESENGRPIAPGNINGGFFPRRDDMPAQYPAAVVGVDDIHTVIAKINDAGGEVLGEPIEIPGIGLYVAFLDTEGNRSSLLQPGA